MIVGLLLGGGLGLGVFVLLRALVWSQPRLARSLVDLDRPRMSVADRRSLDRAGRAEVWERRLGRSLVALVEGLGIDLDRSQRNLRVVGRPRERLCVEKVAAALVGLVMPVLWALLLTSGGIAVPGGLVVFFAFAAAAGGFVLPDVILRRAAAARRDGFRHALSSYLDLVNVVLAGGAGIETALRAAADAGDGWAFTELRSALDRAQFTRASPWDVFDEMGDELAIAELCELSASARLAGEQGARVKSSLVAKAASLRGHEIARIEAAAQSASERMAIPTVLLFTAFIVFIGYPALAVIVGGSGL
jgi:Flp pilus assembly protein TadB